MNLSKYGNGSSPAEVGVALRVREVCRSGSGQKELFSVGNSLLAARASHGEVGDWEKSGRDRRYSIPLESASCTYVPVRQSQPARSLKRSSQRSPMLPFPEQEGYFGLTGSTDMELAAELSGLPGLAEFAAADRSRCLSSCSRCRIAGGGLSNKLHFTS